MSKRPLNEKIVRALRASYETVGPLSPVIVSADGEVIEGRHRKAANPDWPEKEVETVSEGGKALVWLGAHTRRGSVMSEEEEADRQSYREEFRERLEAAGRYVMGEYGLDPEKGEVVKFLSRLTGYTEAWIRENLPENLKSRARAEAAKARKFAQPSFAKPEAPPEAPKAEEERPAKPEERPKRKVPEEFAKPVGIYCGRQIGIRQHIDCLRRVEDESLEVVQADDKDKYREFFWKRIGHSRKERARWEKRLRRTRR